MSGSKHILASALVLSSFLTSLLPASADNQEVSAFCQRVDRKLSSVGQRECLSLGLQLSGAYSNQDTPLLYRDYGPSDDSRRARVLLIGGIHGDEYSSVSVVFKWLRRLEREQHGQFHWRVVPVLNPDGLLRPPRMSQRMNANGVDLNRNFPSPGWDTEAPRYWQERTRRNKRRYPGPAALSEPESRWLVEQLDSFQPDAVISVHAPHGIVDFDGPRVPPTHLGPLDLRLLGTYPGSMGRYIGVHRGIPLLTVELESAFAMPPGNDMALIWEDTLAWIEQHVVEPRLAAEARKREHALALEAEEQANETAGRGLGLQQ